MRDFDNDGYGDLSSPNVTAGSDCNDMVALTNPNGTDGPLRDGDCDGYFNTTSLFL